MPTDFNRSAGNPTTTARELANELGRFAADLKETTDELRVELDNMKQAESDIETELADTAQNFVQNTLTDLEGDEFDTIAEVAQNVSELGSQGLAYYRNSMMSARDEALQSVNETLDNAVDAAGFQDVVTKAREKYDAADEKADRTQTELSTAQSALQDWEDNSVEDDLVRLDESIRKNGGVALTSDNRSFYEGNIFVAVWRYVTNSAYRDTRRSLDSYGHGVNGKDAFADLANFREKYDNFNNAIATAQNAYDKADTDRRTAGAVIERLSDAARKIKTNEQILEAVQNKVVKDLQSSPEFIKAMAAQFEEDFPRNLPLLVAKQSTLAKLEKGTGDKLKSLQTQYKEVARQYQRMGQLRPNQRVRGDLGTIQKHNRARTAEYRRYSRAARDSWTRTRDFEWNYDRNRVVYVDNGPSYLETLLIYNMLSDQHHHHDTDHVPSEKDFHADENSRFAADLVGVDRDAGKDMGLPGSTFELSEDAKEEMDGFEPGSSFDLDKSDDFQLENDSPSSSDSGFGHSSRDSHHDSGSSFNLDDDKPSDSGFGHSSRDSGFSGFGHS